MTYDQVKNSYILKIVKRALMKQYPWIKDVELEQNDFDDYKTVMFLNLYIDPYMLGDENDWTVASWVKPGYDAGTTIGMFFKERFPYHEVSDDVNGFIDNVTDSPAIPEELRLPKPKNSFHVSSFISI
jgi:hypothetical protein